MVIARSERAHRCDQAAAPRSGESAARPLEVVNRPLAALRLDAKNPRRHDPAQVAHIARSIKAFGFNVPVLIDAGGNVVAGHGRVLASRELGLTEVPTICLEHLSAAQKRAFMIADNRMAETSAWDERLLAQELRELKVLDLDFDLAATGFAHDEIELRIEGAVSPPNPPLESEGRTAKGSPGSDNLPSRRITPSRRAGRGDLPLPRGGEAGSLRATRLRQREAELARREQQLIEREAKLAEWETRLDKREMWPCHPVANRPLVGAAHVQTARSSRLNSAGEAEDWRNAETD